MTPPVSRPFRATLAGCCALATASAGLLFAAPARAAAPAAAHPATTAAAPYPNYAPTPPMGWNDWSYYQCGENEQIVLDNARALVSSGLAAKGYNTVTIDDCWMSADRDASGDLVADPSKFPDGMAYVGRQLHAMGLKFGIYEDAGSSTCGGYPGSQDHWQQDADLFASWGVDYVKLDGCNVATPSGETDEQAYYATYAAMSKALLDSGRTMVFSISAPAYFEGTSAWDSVIGWSAQLGNLWREGDDIALGQESGADKWSSILDNYGYNVGLADLQRPGRWNDPDFLLAGDSGLTQDEIQSQVSLWAMMAAPLISSTDLTRLSPGALAALGNKDVIAVDQDPLGLQGRIVAQGTGYDVLSKPLTGGDRAVALFNSSDSAQTVTTSAKAAGLPAGSSFELKNLLTKAVTRTTGTIAADVPPHATVIYRVSPGGGRDVQPATAITWQNVSTVTDPSTYLVTLDDLGPTRLSDVRLTVTAPKGWTVTPASDRLRKVHPGAAGYTVVSVKGPRNAAPGTTVTAVTATGSYRAGKAGAGSVSGQQTITSVVPYPTLASAFNNVGVTSESAPAPGNFDSTGDSYSAEALATEAGVTPGSTISAHGLTFTWPTAAAGTPDNVAATGEQITLDGKGSSLAFLGSETGAVSGTVLVTYTDGSTSTGQLGFPNWCCTPPDAYGAQVALTTDHRDTPTGPANYGISYQVFSNTVPLTAGKTVQSVTLPDQPAIHLFALSVAP
ncbi:alpha-galactosidase [Streptacidiphilus sp. PB12-B1b]|uniref:NEW3 domain-containing protein n=1 Tax=Streptacidiphilus sp. PB12-B1b TaxID=2705012 RepID=UPI0015FD05DC|nr:NEW3 domain-containing protein [Streptacidiphilus sp. PB12-B1b]QMU77003.1 alpha-galactosidase [Streptacidiphilus sp. PB12-B1b]